MISQKISSIKKPESSLLLQESNILVKKFEALVRRLKARHLRHYRDSNFHLWADVLLAGILIGLLIVVIRLVLWQPQAEFSLTGEFANARVLSGQAEELVISYKNEEDGLIKATSLALVLPDNFTIESATPQEIFNSETKTFNLGDLAKNDHGKLKLLVIPRGEVGEKQLLGLNLTYQFGQVRKQLFNSLSYYIDGSVMELSLEAPNETYKDIAFSGSVLVKNIGQAKIENAALAFPNPDWEILPDEVNLDNGRIILSALAPGESTTITFSAVNKQSSDNSNFIVQGLFLAGEKTFKQVEVVKNIIISEPALYLKSVFVEQALSGNMVNANLSLENSGETEISNLSLAFESKRNTIGVSSVMTEDKNFTATNNFLSYNSDIKSGEKKDFTTVIKLEKKGTNLNDWLNLNIVLSYSLAGKEFKYIVPMPRLKINSNLTVTSAGYYYGPQGDQLGIGPLPPIVDVPTTYWVIWEANNLGNEVANFEVLADLPVNVVWLDQKSVVAGDVTYSPVTRRILWRIDKLSQTGGNYRASFAISLVPRLEDLGAEPNLLSNIQFRANDLYTGATISKNLANITTNIEKDSKSFGKSKVENNE